MAGDICNDCQAFQDERTCFSSHDMVNRQERGLVPTVWCGAFQDRPVILSYWPPLDWSPVPSGLGKVGEGEGSWSCRQDMGQPNRGTISLIRNIKN